MSSARGRRPGDDAVFRRKAAYLVCDGQLEEWEVADLLDRELDDVKVAVSDYLSRGEDAFDDGFDGPPRSAPPGISIQASPDQTNAIFRAGQSEGEQAYSALEVWPDMYPDLPPIQTMARIRPISEREKGLASGLCVEAPSSTEVLFKLNERELRKQAVSADFKRKNKMEYLSFHVHQAFDMASHQDSVYAASGRPVLSKVMQGYNGCILAYGQTGSGKTFTMEGQVSGWGSLFDETNGGLVKKPKKKKANATPFCAADGDRPGIIPLIVADLFRGTARLARSMLFTITITYIEIYMETVVDLLADADHVAVRAPDVVEDKTMGGKGIYVQNAREVEVNSLEDVMLLLQQGFALRRTGETEMNKRSSRSHAVLSLYITSQARNDREGLTKLKSKLHLVDLAGSERLKDTNAKGDRLKEGNAINSSLSTLAACLKSMTSTGKIPRWRESKITRLLQDSLGGNAFAVFLCALSPALLNQDESLSTIRFASMANKIKAQPKQNLDPLTEAKLANKSMKKRIQQLESLLIDSGLEHLLDVSAPSTAISSRRPAERRPVDSANPRGRTREGGTREGQRGGERGIPLGGGGATVSRDSTNRFRERERERELLSREGGRRERSAQARESEGYPEDDARSATKDAARAATAHLKAKRHRAVSSHGKKQATPATMRGSAVSPSAREPHFPSVQQRSGPTYGEIHGAPKASHPQYSDSQSPGYGDEYSDGYASPESSHRPSAAPRTEPARKSGIRMDL